jgi:hypothetical protein
MLFERIERHRTTAILFDAIVQLLFVASSTRWLIPFRHNCRQRR